MTDQHADGEARKESPGQHHSAAVCAGLQRSTKQEDDTRGDDCIISIPRVFLAQTHWLYGD